MLFIVDGTCIATVNSETLDLKPGDVVSIDCGVYYKGYHSDSAYSYPVEVEDEAVHSPLVEKSNFQFCRTNAIYDLSV